MNAGQTGRIERPLSRPTQRFLTKTTLSGHIRCLLLTISSGDISAATSAFGQYDGPNERFRHNAKDVSLQVAGCDTSSNFLDVLTNRSVGFSNNLKSLSLVDEVRIECLPLDLARTNTRLMTLSSGTTYVPGIIGKILLHDLLFGLETLELKLRNSDASWGVPKVEGIPFFELKDSEQDFADLMSVIECSGCMPALRTIELKIWDYYQWIYFPKPEMEAWSLNPYSVGPLPVFGADFDDTTSANSDDSPTEQEWIEIADPCWTGSIHKAKGLVDWQFLDESLETLMPASLATSAIDIADARTRLIQLLDLKKRLCRFF
ncbi:hypothetical protein BJ165DRAFT_1406209 [Panaeolus papilionaceus]|nr:hypothetical protein BJ165DRAFT_1406209 [Panaeolus papilionaceus]